MAENDDPRQLADKVSKLLAGCDVFTALAAIDIVRILLDHHVNTKLGSKVLERA